ncbi:MAG: acetoacetate decarboxylase family protein [bacterium]|nr:acetoacetate decarboxylase family protein [bacterium]
MNKSDCMPVGGSLIVPGPYYFKNLNMYAFFCRTAKPENLKLFLPPGLRLWNPLFPKGVFLVTLVDYPQAWAEARPEYVVDYREACIFFPVFHLKAGPALYCPFIYLDNTIPGISAGREVYGFPKKPAAIPIKETKTGGTGSVTEEKDMILQASWKLGPELTMPEVMNQMVSSVSSRFGFMTNYLKEWMNLFDKYLPRKLLQPRVPVINWKRIPAINATVKKPVWSVNELTLTRFKIDNIHRHHKLIVKKDAVKLKKAAYAPFDKFNPIETLFGLKINLDFTLPTGKVLKKL